MLGSVNHFSVDFNQILVDTFSCFSTMHTSKPGLRWPLVSICLPALVVSLTFFLRLLEEAMEADFFIFYFFAWVKRGSTVVFLACNIMHNGCSRYDIYKQTTHIHKHFYFHPLDNLSWSVIPWYSFGTRLHHIGKWHNTYTLFCFSEVHLFYSQLSEDKWHWVAQCGQKSVVGRLGFIQCH